MKWLKKTQANGLRHNIVVLILLFTLLPVLAVLQYRWLGQLSEGEKARMQSNIKISSERFAEDFDFELSKIYSVFSNIHFKSNNTKGIQNALDEVRDVLLFPGLIKDVYLIEIRKSDKPLIREFLESQNIFVPLGWPERFKGIFSQINKTSNLSLSMLIAMSHRPGLSDPPLILISTNPVTRRIWSGKSAVSFLMIELSKEVIIDELLATLADKYFNSEDEQLYHYAIIRQDSSASLFFKSSPDPVHDFLEQSLTSVEIGNWRLERFMVAATKLVLKDSIPNMPSQKKIRVQQGHQISVEIIEQDSLFKEESFEFTISKTIPWKLYLKHASGDLDTIVQDARNLNLVISYVILFLLGLSIAFVYNSARKTQKTAMQQIEFVAGLTHELRTPLATIRSAAENIKDGIIKDKSKIREYGELIYKEDVRLTQMIEQTLYFSGISFGGQKINKVETDIMEIINKISDLYKNTVIQIELARLPKIKADPQSLRIMFSNLLSNAVKYNKNNNPVKIKGHASADGQKIEIHFIDQGKGIARQDIPHIFELFYRGEEAKKDQLQGSGIGLSLVKKIIDAHQGSISVYSEPGTGSTFSVILPL